MIYLVSRTDRQDYDEYGDVIVRATSRREALELVLTGHEWPPEPLPGYRADGSNAKVTPVHISGKSEIIVTSFRAG